MNQPSAEDPELEKTLVQIVRATRWLSQVLEAVRAVAPPGWYVAAGAVRDTVWDSLSRFHSEGPLGDIDIVYFDVEDTIALYGAQLRARFPEYEWEITNQAFVHRWQGRARGRTVEPFRSVADAIGAWPETATAVGVTLDHGGELGRSALTPGLARTSAALSASPTVAAFRRGCSSGAGHVAVSGRDTSNPARSVARHVAVAHRRAGHLAAVPHFGRTIAGVRALDGA